MSHQRNHFFPLPADNSWEIVTNNETTGIIFDDCASLCCSENMREPFEKFSEQIEKYYRANRQSPSEFRAKQQLQEIILRILQTKTEKWTGWPCSAIAITGSTITGLGSQNSDVDLCVLIPGALQYYPNEKEACRNCVKIMEYRLCENEEFCSIITDPITGHRRIRYIDASIPVLKIVARIEKLDVECDLTSCCNEEGFVSALHNSFLLRHYVRFDERVGPLCFFIKRWAKNFGVYDPVNGRLNSYCLTLLVIHYLQCALSPPILPNLSRLYPGFFALSEQDFPKTIDFDAPLPDEVPKQDRNPLAVGHLFYGFITYYFSFDFKRLRIDMKESRVKNRTPKRDRVYALDIRDPIDHHNPGRTLQQEGLDYILELLKETKMVFQNAATTGRLPPFEYLIGDGF